VGIRVTLVPEMTHPDGPLAPLSFVRLTDTISNLLTELAGLVQTR
jgi:hypothetical protein